MLSTEASSTIFWVFGMTRLGIEPRSPRPLANTLTITPILLKELCVELKSLFLLLTCFGHTRSGLLQVCYASPRGIMCRIEILIFAANMFWPHAFWSSAGMLCISKRKSSGFCFWWHKVKKKKFFLILFLLCAIKEKKNRTKVSFKNFFMEVHYTHEEGQKVYGWNTWTTKTKIQWYKYFFVY